jgi:[acyl-carrier-protein] S-malonyltransferase
MGKDLYEHGPAEAKKVFDEADEVLGFSLSRLCFEGPFEELTKTRNCQPAVLAASIAALAALKAAYPQLSPSYVAGLSLGEYTALVAAEIVSFQDALSLVRSRGFFMEEAARKNPGKMICVLGLEVDVVRALCAATQTQIANLNCPGQVVVSGTHQQIEALTLEAEKKGAKRVIPLDVSGAFHCSLMKDAALRLTPEIDKITFRRGRYPLISNVDAREQTDPQVIKKNLIKQVDGATYWEASMRYLLGVGVDLYFEIGPGTVLKGLMKKTAPGAMVVSAGRWEEIQQANTRESA